MKKLLLYILAISSSIALIQCGGESLDNPLDYELKERLATISTSGDWSSYILPEANDYANIPQDPLNPLNKAKVELGKMLFFETGLALDPAKPFSEGTYSCGSCHVPAAAFTPGRIQGIADGGTGFGDKGEGRTGLQSYHETEMDVQGARPISLLNVAYQTNTSWNGKFGAGYANQGTEHLWDNDPTLEGNSRGLSGLESQNIEGLHLHRMVVGKEIYEELGYIELFDAAFPERNPEYERYNDIATSFAISAYLRTLLTTEAPFQVWLKNKRDHKKNTTVMTDQEKRGALLFFDDAGCYKCHKGGSLNATEFYAIGVKDLYETGQAFNTGPDDKRNLGRGGFTGEERDLYKFKVPQLYNMSDAPFLFHGSSMTSLREAVEYFNEGVAENPATVDNIDTRLFKPLNLTEEDIQDLTAFLESALRDPNLERYVPDSVLSGNCMPNNDPASQEDRGCN